MKYRAICGALYNRPLLLLPEKADEIHHLIRRCQAEITVDGKEFPPHPKAYLTTEHGAVAPIDAVGSSGSGKFVAVLPLFGTLYQHGGLEMEASGGTSTAQFMDQFGRLVANPSIKSIVIEAHTPGGQVWGTQETADAIYAARSRKRIVAIANSMAASAGVWITTAASEVYVTPGGEMGSIGVVTIHEDISGAEDKAGVRTTLIAYPSKKISGHPFAPLSDADRSELESKIKETYQRFVGAVARNRGVSTAIVENRFGGGGMLRAQQAVAAGLADRIATKSEVLGREIQRLNVDTSRKSVKNQLAIARLRMREF